MEGLIMAKRLREAEALRPGRDPVRKTGRGSPKSLVLLDLISGEKGCQNDGADQEGNHPVHVAHCFPLSLDVAREPATVRARLGKTGTLEFLSFWKENARGHPLEIFAPPDPLFHDHERTLE